MIYNNIEDIEKLIVTKESGTDILGNVVSVGDYVVLLPRGKSLIFGMYFGCRSSGEMVITYRMPRNMYMCKFLYKRSIIKVDVTNVPNANRKRNSELEDYLWLSKKLEIL